VHTSWRNIHSFVSSRI